MFTEFLILGTVQAGLKAIEKIHDRKEAYEESLDAETKQKREETQQRREENREKRKEKLHNHVSRSSVDRSRQILLQHF